MAANSSVRGSPVVPRISIEILSMRTFRFQLLLFLSATLSATPAPAKDPASMRDLIERFTSDLRALERRHGVPLSSERWERLGRFFKDQERILEEVDFEALDPAGRIDYHLLRNRLRHERSELEREEKLFGEVSGLLPF